MKKALAVIWVVAYLLLSTGVVVNFHYCMNQLASTQFYGGKQEVCGRCGMDAETSHGCCRDEIKVIKMDDDHQLLSLTAWALQAPALIEEESSAFFRDFVPQLADRDNWRNHSPPPLHAQDTYLQNSVFRI